MTIKYELEYLDSNKKYQYVDVEFGCDFRWDNDSMDYEWWGSRESINGDNYAVLEEINWDKTKHTEEENKAITAFLDDYDSKEYQRFEEYVTKEYEEECANWEPDDY